MTRRLARLALPVLVVVGSLAVPASALAASDLFMKIDGVAGENLDPQYPKSSALAEFSETADHPLGGKVDYSDFEIKKNVDSTSTYLLSHANTGATIPSIRIIDRGAGGKQVSFLQFCLEQPVVTSYEVSSGDESPEETVKFAAQQFEMRYLAQKADGSPLLPATLTGWDLVAENSIGFNDNCGGIRTR